MKKILTLFMLIALLSLGNISYAHPGGLDKNGGHYCKTNCTKYGLKNGQYHCHRSRCKLK